MILIPYSFSGTSLQSTDYSSSFPRAQANLQITSQPGYVKRAGAVPVYAGKDFMPQVLTLEVLCIHDFTTLFESINTLFDTKDETPRQFICTDSEDSNKQYYVYATAQQVLGGHDGPMATVTLALDDPIWQSVTQNSQTWTSTSSTSTTDVTTGGNDYSYPLFEITPTSSPSTDYIYTQYVQVLPRSTNSWTKRPLCLTPTSGTLDTAALVAAGKMQADGDDLRVFANGVEQNRWLSGINTTDTKVWVVADMPEARNFTLKTAIGATDTVTEIEVNYSTSSLEQIGYLPNAGYLIVDTDYGATDSEQFSYTARVVTGTKLAFTISTRALENTLAVAHSANTNVRFLPYSWTMRYGSATATTPDTVDTYKPIVSLSSSSNSLFAYVAQFYNLERLRAGIFRPFVRKSDPIYSRSTYYTSTDDQGDTDPSSTMGMKALTYESGGAWRPDSVFMSWTASFPDGITSFAMNGYRIQNTSSFVPWGVYYADIATSILTPIWVNTAQSATDYGTWTIWAMSSSDLSVFPANLDTFRFVMQGSILGDTDTYSKADIQTLSVTLTNPPHVAFRTELATAISVDLSIANTTTGESFKLKLPVVINDTVYVDTDPDFPTVTHNGQVVNGSVKLSSTRAAWLRLSPGSNTLTFDNNLSVANDYTITIKWRDRMNYF